MKPAASKEAFTLLAIPFGTAWYSGETFNPTPTISKSKLVNTVCAVPVSADEKMAAARINTAVISARTIDFMGNPAWR